MKLQRENGFTLIELLFVIGTISILASLSWGSYQIYKLDAEYSKAESLIKTAQTAIVLGNMEATAGESHGYEESGTAGGVLPNSMQQFLPGATTPKDVALGAMLESCVDDSPVINLFLVARPCKSDREVTWVQFCDGTQILTPSIAGGGC